MTTMMRRLLALAVLAFWQGGFTFYASVVVPMAQAQIGHTRQGFITRHVTDYLNVSGAVALLVLVWDSATPTPAARARRLRWISWLVMALTLVVLVWLHGRMEGLLEVEDVNVVDRPTFRGYHRCYLWVNTVQWSFALIYTAAMVWAWRAEDRAWGEPGA